MKNGMGKPVQPHRQSVVVAVKKDRVAPYRPTITYREITVTNVSIFILLLFLYWAIGQEQFWK